MLCCVWIKYDQTQYSLGIGGVLTGIVFHINEYYVVLFHKKIKGFLLRC